LELYRLNCFRSFKKLTEVIMKNPQDSISAIQSAEADNPSEKQIAQNKSMRNDHNNSRTTNQNITIISHLRQRLDWSLVATILAIKALLIVFAGQIYQVVSGKPVETWHGWLDIWNLWDSLRHIRLAEIGYSGVGSDKADIVGFPLYPWLVRFFAFVFQDSLVSAFIVSGLATVAAGLLLHRLVRADYPDSIARNSVWFLLIFPTAHFLHINYNESLFIALTVGCFLAARQERWSLAGILGALVCLTRLNGLVIIPALLVEMLLQYQADRRLRREWLWIVIVPFGFGIYLLLNEYITGDAFTFIAVGKENFQKSFSMPWIGIESVYNVMWSPEPPHAQMVGVQEFVFILLGGVCTVASAFLLRPSYTVWMAGNWLLITSVGFLISVPRYTIVMFPIFILFARLAERRFWHSVITVWSLLLLAFFIGEFIQGHWAF
jgi:hypothetical protein